MKDYYQILGVPRTATADDIKKAYRRLAKQYHPDITKGDKQTEERFKEISEAYNVLSDCDQRRKYDAIGSAYERAQGGWQPFSGQGGGQGGAYEDVQYEGFGDLGDILKDLFEMGGIRRGPFGPKASKKQSAVDGKDMFTDVDISFQEAVNGTERSISIQRGDRTEKISIKIPAGVDNGSKVRVSGKGQLGFGGGRAGDLFLRVHVAPHPTFWREGADIYMELPITIYDAVLGNKVEVPTLEGNAVMKIPEGTASGQKFRLKGKGAPTPGKKGSKGDQYVIVQIAPPTRLNSEERRMYEELSSRYPYRPKK